MTPQTRTVAQELRRELETLYGNRLMKMLLFGSEARGEAEPGSDIDVLIVLQGQVRPGEEISRIGGITSALSLKFDTVISCTFVSADRFLTEQSPLLLNVRREGVAV